MKKRYRAKRIFHIEKGQHTFVNTKRFLWDTWSGYYVYWRSPFWIPSQEQAYIPCFESLCWHRHLRVPSQLKRGLFPLREVRLSSYPTITQINHDFILRGRSISNRGVLLFVDNISKYAVLKRSAGQRSLNVIYHVQNAGRKQLHYGSWMRWTLHRTKVSKLS